MADELLSRIEALLVELIPAAVAAAKVREPVYALIVWFHGGETYGPERTPQLLLVRESWRQAVLSDSAKSADPAYYLWSHDEVHEPAKSIFPALAQAELGAKCTEWYEERYSHDDLDDEEALTPIREALQRVCRKLNDLDWTKIAPVTDDFVVYPGDGSHTFMNDGEDILASVPAEKIALLQSRGLFPSM